MYMNIGKDVAIYQRGDDIHILPAAESFDHIDSSDSNVTDYLYAVHLNLDFN